MPGQLQTPPAGADEAWSEFCAGLLAASGAIAECAPGVGAADRVEGHQQLATLIEAALRWYLRGGDADFPRFVEINDTPEVADNLFAPVRGDAEYRIRGRVASLFDLNLSVHTGWGWLKPSKSSGDLGRGELQVDADGCVEIIASAKPRPGNWLPLPPDAEYIQIREYHHGYEPNAPGIWDIARIGADGQAPPRMTPDEFRQRLDLALAWARSYLPFHMRVQKNLWPAGRNGLNPPITHPGGNSHIWYGFGRFALAPDEALVLEFDAPQARLWSVQWLTSPWYENPDLVNRQTGLPSGEIHVDADGRVRIVLAGTDPRVPNWLDTSDHGQGYIVTRWIWCEHGPEVTHRVLPLAQLRAHLPAGTPIVAPEARAAQLARRRTHFACRRR
ncbi:MAG: DUF1214 domain-containing protein [Gammaproteobacteria bacterium]